MKKLYGKIVALILCVLCMVAVAACGGMKEVTYEEFKAKATEAQALDAGYTGGTIKYRQMTGYYGLVEYEGGFTIENGEVTLTDLENGNENGRDQAVWYLENERVWNREKYNMGVYKIGDGFLVEEGMFVYEYDEFGYFVKETNDNFDEENWIIQITWTK